MSDLSRRLKQDAEDLDRAADREQGTLSAYWRGFAAGLRQAQRMVSNEETRKAIDWTALKGSYGAAPAESEDA